MSSKSPSLVRLKKEYKAIQKDPTPYIFAAPLPTNILEWHYVLQGPPDSPFSGGLFHGKIRFPPEYPHRPPSIYMLTPNGRFDVNRRICMSMSDFHPESWNPMWSVASILSGLLSFMLDNERSTGCVETTVAQKQRLASESIAYNPSGPNKNIYNSLFPTVTPVGVCQHVPAAPGPAEGPSAPAESNLLESAVWTCLAAAALGAILYNV